MGDLQGSLDECPNCPHSLIFDHTGSRCDQPGCPCGLSTAEVKAEAIARVDANAAPSWQEEAFQALLVTAERHETFTADEMWDELGPAASDTHEPSALGPVFLRAARAKLIVKTGELRLSKNPRRHRDLTVWRQT